MPLPCPRRGHRALPRLVIETRFPFGLFRAWSYWQPAAQVLVWPDMAGLNGGRVPKFVKKYADLRTELKDRKVIDRAKGLLMLGPVPDLDLFHPWTPSVETAVMLARECEAAGLAFSPAIQNSEGASVSSHQGHFVMANSLGFLGGYPTSRHSIGCALIAADDVLGISDGHIGDDQKLIA